MSCRRCGLWLCLLLALTTSACASHVERDGPFAAVRDTPTQHALHDHYRQWQGTPYRYGGRDESGIDCSSFVRQTFGALAAVELPRTTAAQARLGEHIDRDELSPGDLVFFKTGHKYRHVGIYIGGGRFMHASTSEGVTLSRLDNVYWQRHYWQSRRVLAVAD